MNSLKKMYYKSAAAITTIALSTVSANAQTNLSELSSKMEGQLGAVPKLIQIVCYLGALGFGIAGVMSLKEYMDKPGSVKLSQPLGRLLVGGLLVSIPALISIMSNSSTGTGSLSTSSFDYGN